jgi:hypothetical protein
MSRYRPNILSLARQCRHWLVTSHRRQPLKSLIARAEAAGILVLPVGHSGAVVLAPDRR